MAEFGQYAAPSGAPPYGGPQDSRGSANDYYKGSSSPYPQQASSPYPQQGQSPYPQQGYNQQPPTQNKGALGGALGGGAAAGTFFSSCMV